MYRDSVPNELIEGNGVEVGHAAQHGKRGSSSSVFIVTISLRRDEKSFGKFLLSEPFGLAQELEVLL